MEQNITDDQAFWLWKQTVNQTLEDAKITAQVSWDTSRKDAEIRFLAILKVGKYTETVISDPFPKLGEDRLKASLILYMESWMLKTEHALTKIASQLLQEYSNETIRR